jgi:hypothetical protein
VNVPRVRWRAGRSVSLFGLAGGFVLLSFLVPQRYVALGAGNRLEIDRDVEKLAEQIELLKEEAILEPARADSLKQKLDQLQDDASGKDPAKTLEALDHLADVASKAAKEAAENSARKAEQLAKAETLAEGLGASGDALDAKVLAEAMKELSALAQKAAKETDLLEKDLDPETLKALKEGVLSPEQLEKLAGALGKCKGGLNKRLAKLAKAGLIDLETLRRCEKSGECACKGSDLAAFLKEHSGCCLADILTQCETPGRGGVSRGPGAAELTFGDASSEEGMKFKEEALPPAELEALKESKLTGLSREAPTVEKGGSPSKSGALQGAAAGAGSAHTQVVLPRHRGAVERYFERPGRPAK